MFQIKYHCFLQQMPPYQRNSSGQHVVHERGEYKTAWYSSVFLPFQPSATWLCVRNLNRLKKMCNNLMEALYVMNIYYSPELQFCS